MTCNLARPLLPLAAGEGGDDLPEAVLARVMRHVERCPSCEAELLALEAAMSPLAELGRLERGEGAADAARPLDSAAARPDPLGENFWLAIRRDLRSEGLVSRPGVVPEGAPQRSRDLVAAPLPGGSLWGGLLPRMVAAGAMAVLAAALFLPEGLFRREAGRLPAPEDMAVRSSAGTGPAVAFSRPAAPLRDVGPASGMGLPGTLETDGAGIRRVAAGAPEAVRGALGSGILRSRRPRSVAITPGTVPGWVEETKSFSAPEVEYMLERWKRAPKGGAEADESGPLSF